MPANREDSIREHAYRLWEVQGKPEGRDKEHWQQAEKELSPAGPGENRTPDNKIGEVKYAEESAGNKANE
jgi:hypothetical protein